MFKSRKTQNLIQGDYNFISRYCPTQPLRQTVLSLALQSEQTWVTDSEVRLQISRVKPVILANWHSS